MLTRGNRSAAARLCVAGLLCGSVLVASDARPVVAEVSPDIVQSDLLGPVGSVSFGRSVLVLSNGNFVVSDPDWDGAGTDRGIVRLYDGATETVISEMQGARDDDRFGSGGFDEVGDSNFVVTSQEVSSASVSDVGAITWGDGETGFTDPVVSLSNSLMTTTFNGMDNGLFATFVVVLDNGNYLVVTDAWNNGIDAVGAVTWASGDAPLTGIVSIANSLIGSTNADGIEVDVDTLSGGDYVVAWEGWDGPGGVDVGAVTLGDGENGTFGAVNSSNSLIGTSPNDSVGSGNVVQLTNGNLVVSASGWDGAFTDMGAVTWIDRSVGTSGEVSAANSLTGNAAYDRVGSVSALTNGNYVVYSRSWDGPFGTDVGAVTWGNGSTGTTGIVNVGNSLVGTNDNDSSNGRLTVLANGNYVYRLPRWDSGPLENVGAAALGDGNGGTVGAIGPSNSLVGSSAEDGVGNGVTALTNGNFVVRSSSWDSPSAANVGAATWVDGEAGLVGEVGAANSLIGTTVDDRVGVTGVALANGNYVVGSYRWDDGAVVDVGAATWANGATGLVGTVSAANSLIGSFTGDEVASFFSGLVALTNGNYLVRSPEWSGGGPATAGSVTWGNGSTGTTGVVGAGNSLIGTVADDHVGGTNSSGVETLANGDYVVISEDWSGGGPASAGAVTLGDGMGGTTVGPVSATNSLVGTFAGDDLGSSGLTIIDDTTFLVRSREYNAGRGAVSLGVTSASLAGEIDTSNSVIGTPPGVVVFPEDKFTANDSIAVATTQNRLLMMRVDRGPFFVSPPSDVTVATAPGATTATVTYSTPVADDLRDVAVPPVACVPASGTAFSVGDTTVTCTATDSKGLTSTTSFLVTVTATPAVVDPPGPSGPDVVSLTPGRVLETRVGEDTVDGVSEGDGRVGAMSEIEVDIAGRAGVAADAVAAVLNVTAINPSGRGFVTIHPCGTRPLASSLNYAGAGAVVGNEVVAKLSGDGSVCIFTSAETHLTADVVGYVPNGSPVTSLTPGRVLETRVGEDTVDGVSEGDGRVGAMSEIEVDIAGRAGVATDAVAAVLNVTAINPSGRGFVTIHPCGTRPLASSLNYAGAGAVVGNEVVAKLSGDGSVCVFTSAETHLTADVVGYVPSGAATTSLTPGRVLETRPGEDTVDDVSEGDGRVDAMSEIEVDIAGRAGVPTSGVGAVVMNVTAINPSSRGFVTIHPCGTRPLASSLNYAGTGAVAGNEVIAKLSGDGSVCIFTSAETHLTADVVGYVPA